jgi:F-type H+-transporting ATPase subunit epsilon
MNTCPLLIMTPKQKIFEGNITLLNVMTLAGQIGILAAHQPLLAIVKTGPLHIIENNKTTYYATSGGVLTVKKEQTILLLDAIERVDTIDVDRAKEALKRAEERLQHRHDKVDAIRAKAAIERALNRISVYEEFFKD